MVQRELLMKVMILKLYDSNYFSPTTQSRTNDQSVWNITRVQSVLQRGLNESNQRFEHSILNSSVIDALLNFEYRISAKAPHKLETTRTNGVYIHVLIRMAY